MALCWCWLQPGCGERDSWARPSPHEMAMPICPGHWLLACFHMCFLTEPFWAHSSASYVAQ